MKQKINSKLSERLTHNVLLVKDKGFFWLGLGQKNADCTLLDLRLAPRVFFSAQLS